jgi:hypothetical protein
MRRGADGSSSSGGKIASALLAAAALAFAAGAFAQPRPTARPAPSASASAVAAPSAPIATHTERGAILAVATSIARDLGKVSGRVLVAAGPPTSDTPAPKGAQLALAIANQVAGRRGAGAHVLPQPGSIGAARASVHGESALVYLSIEIAGGELRVTADAYPVPANVWARARDAEPGPIAHAFARAPLDAEVRAFLTPIPLVAAHVDRAKNFESDVVALACGDLDGDGALEIVSVSRRRVTSVRLRGGRVLPIVSKNWPDLAPVAPAPLREPLAFATFAIRSGVPSVDIALTDRAFGVRLDASLHVMQTLPGIVVPDGDATACAKWTGLTVTGPTAACAPGDAAPLSTSIGGRYDAFASARLISPRGDPFDVWAGREGDKLEVRDDRQKKITFDEVGAQIAVGDLDQDGDAEIITTLDTANALEDVVVVRSWSRSDGKLKDKLRIPAAAGVRALAVCPPDGPGRAPFVVATTDEIWVVR